jgi:hypothetical protein
LGSAVIASFLRIPECSVTAGAARKTDRPAARRRAVKAAENLLFGLIAELLGLCGFEPAGS